MTDYDSPWKEALDVFFEAFLQLFFPQAHAEIDWSRGWESLDKELQKIVPEAETGRRYVDKLVKVWLKSGQEQWLLIHIEVQMTDEAGFSSRMYVNHCRLVASYNEREVVSLAVLGDENPHWRPESFSYRRWGMEVGFRFPIVKLLDYAARRVELEESDNPFATVVLAHLDTQETRQEQGERKNRKFRLVKRLRHRGWSETQVRQLFKLIDWMMDLPKPLENEFWREVKQYEENEIMPFITTPERYGRAESRIEDIEVILETRFPDDCAQLMPEIRRIQDAEELKKVFRAAATATSADELRKLLISGLAR